MAYSDTANTIYIADFDNNVTYPTHFRLRVRPMDWIRVWVKVTVTLGLGLRYSGYGWNRVRLGFQQQRVLLRVYRLPHRARCTLGIGIGLGHRNRVGTWGG
eukprot:350174-Amorphochlora_amoeboformis.AAC.1